jgi:DNA-binding response OmpR family regulator
MKLLIIDDNPDICKIITIYATSIGHDVDSITNLINYQDINFNNYDIVILDVDMPLMNGFELSKLVTCRFLFLSAQVTFEQKVKGLKLGASDYITKPFDLEELFLRINNILKDNQLLKVNGLELNLTTREVKFNDHNINLTLKCFDLLSFLVSNQSKIFTREELLDTVWGSSQYRDIRIVDTHVSTIRKLTSKELIKTVKYEGYTYEG